MVEGENNGFINERTPLMNRRPITLITFPSNPRLEVGSPGKPLIGQGVRSFE